MIDFLALSSVPTVALPLQVMLPDVDDLPWLEVAVAEGVPLVTGNIRTYPKRLRCGVEVLSPRQFLDRLRRETRNAPGMRGLDTGEPATRAVGVS